MHRLLVIIASKAFLLGLTTLSAQSLYTAPFDLVIVFSSQSSGDATKPNIQVTLTNIAGHEVKVLQPRSDGLLQNLQFMVE